MWLCVEWRAEGSKLAPASVPSLEILQCRKRLKKPGGQNYSDDLQRSNRIAFPFFRFVGWKHL